MRGRAEPARQGDFVHKNQAMASDKGFRNVSAKWLAKCITYEQAMEQMASEHARGHDPPGKGRNGRPPRGQRAS